MLVSAYPLLYSEGSPFSPGQTRQGRETMSDGRPAPQNIQDAFLNTVRRDKAAVTVYLVNGAKLSGRIRSFDKFSVLLESGPHEQLIFKHAISTISLTRRSSGELRAPAVSDDPSGQHAQPINQSADSPES